MGNKLIPVTVFTGFVGSGKTTVILDILKQVGDRLKICVLKNEYGDSYTDSQLYKLSSTNKDKDVSNKVNKSSIEVKEIINGCICCISVGKLETGLLDLLQFDPDHILLETSGTAFPAPVVWQINQLSDKFSLDTVITTIDCQNFLGYDDISYTAKLQAQFTDLLLLTKWEQCSERQMDDVIDKVNILNDETAKLKYRKDLGIDLKWVFGVNTKLQVTSLTNQVSEELDCITVNTSKFLVLNKEDVEKFFVGFDKEEVYRVKGAISCLVKDEVKNFLINFAFARPTWIEMDINGVEDNEFKVTLMGNNLKRYSKKILDKFELNDEDIKFWKAKLN